MKSTIWVLVNTNSVKEARKIGRAALEARLAACYGLIPKLQNVYFWPPKSNRFESNRGPTLVFDTLPENFTKLSALVKKLHSDELPFIGKLKIEVSREFYQWVKSETRQETSSQ